MGRHLDNDPMWPQIRREFECGFTLDEIANRYGKTAYQIRYRAKKLGWSMSLRPLQGKPSR